MRRRGLIGCNGSGEPDYLSFTMDDDSASTTMHFYKSSNSVVVSLEYSFDKITWHSYTLGNNITLEKNVNPTVYWRGNDSTIGSSNRNYVSVSFNSKMKAGGNIMTLLDEEGKTDTVPDYCFYWFFNGGYDGSYNLTEPPYLPAKTVGSYGYYGMFNQCYGLKYTPTLPAMTLGTYVYAYMFSQCLSITSASELPCLNLPTRCYDCMYIGCSSLITPPSTLPATNINSYCYNSMFQNSAIESSPIIYTSPSASYCFYNMFKGCSNLSKITVRSTSWNTTNAKTWVDGVSASGDFYKLSSTSIASGKNGIPSGWTVVNT